jgi:hypothetical protein
VFQGWKSIRLPDNFTERSFISSDKLFIFQKLRVAFTLSAIASIPRHTHKIRVQGLAALL